MHSSINLYWSFLVGFVLDLKYLGCFLRLMEISLNLNIHVVMRISFRYSQCDFNISSLCSRSLAQTPWSWFQEIFPVWLEYVSIQERSLSCAFLCYSLGYRFWLCRFWLATNFCSARRSCWNSEQPWLLFAGCFLHGALLCVVSKQALKG